MSSQPGLPVGGSLTTSGTLCLLGSGPLFCMYRVKKFQSSIARVLLSHDPWIALQIVQVGETHGIRFPREFGLLLKQLLYFDRYTRELAPSLSVLRDDRVKLRPQEDGPVVDVF